MISGISSANILNYNQRDLKYNTSFGSSSKNLASGSLFEELTSKNLSAQSARRTKSALLTLGGLSLGGLGLLFALRRGKTSQINKALKAIDTKFADLSSDIPKARKTFGDVFLRDVSEKETVEMLKRYKEIEKLGVTASKEEYFKALFKEAKHNYGLGALPTEFKIAEKPLMGNSSILGFTDPLGDVHISANLSKSVGFNTIHHELRHLKQRYYAFHYAPAEYVKASQPRNFEIPQPVFEQVFSTPVGKAGIPKGHLEFAENSARSLSNYCPASQSTSGYFAQWAEKDAYKAGDDIAKFFGVA